MNQLIILLSIAALMSSCGNKTSGQQDCTQFVSEFYTEYLNAPWDLHEQVESRYFTPALVAKVARMSANSGADAVTASQDPGMTPDFTVKDLGGGWYGVDGMGNIHTVYLKAGEVDGQCRITYISPYGDKWGDELICPGDMPADIDMTSAGAFVESFYKAYLGCYAAMPADLPGKLGELRQSYLTDAARHHIAAILDEAREMGYIDMDPDHYDPLIGGCDFEYAELGKVGVRPAGGDTFTVSGLAHGGSITVTVSGTQGNYRIAGFSE